MKQQAPYVRMKDYDHEDVDTEFTSDGTLRWIATALASFGVFAALMAAIAMVMQIPDSWIEWLLLSLGAV